MIITKTPLRVSLFGGGTDIPVFYKKNRYGQVLSSSINKYIYVYLKSQNFLFKEKIRLNYSQTEIINDVSEIKNDIIRECLKFLKINEKIYIGTVSDIPSSTGLGSSSSFTVGLLNALFKFKKKKVKAKELAKIAAKIEMKLEKNFIGKQDHYAAAFGGFNSFKFYNNGKVIRKNFSSNLNVKKLEKNILLFYTGETRSAKKLLKNQVKNYKNNSEHLNQIKKNASNFEKMISHKNIDLKKIGNLLHSSWEQKKKLTKKISNLKFNRIYTFGLENGATGGKILGAGNGGFFLFLVPASKKRKFISLMDKKGLKNLQIKFENKGSKIIYSKALR